MTDIHIEPKYKDVKQDGCYVYIHYRADDGSIMYVGKGKRGRWISRSGRGAYWLNSARLHGVFSEIAQENMTEDAAFLLEMWLIAKFRHDGENLVNRTDGGEGASGFKQSEETKELRASKIRGHLHPFYGKKLSANHCLNLSISHIGKCKGRSSSSYKTDEFTFWNFDGRKFVGTRNEFKNYSGMSSGSVSRIILGGRRYGKGWYVSDLEMSASEIIDNRRFLPDCRLASESNVYSNLGEVFVNAGMAALEISGPNSSGDLIILACLGTYSTAYGRTWSFSENGPFLEYKDPRRVCADAKFKTIECENGMIFLGAKSASDWLSNECGRRVSNSAIYQAIKNGCNSGGYKWRYKDG